MRKQLVACCKKLFLKVDKIAVKKPSKTQEGITEKRPHRAIPIIARDPCLKR